MKKVTIVTLAEAKVQKQPISMVTAYDATMARIADDAGIDTILVGDSLGMVIGGQDNTLEVSLAEVAYHCRAVRRGAPRPFLIADMPFMTYQVGVEDAVRNAGKLLCDGRAEAVKLEGGVAIVDQIAAITNAGIPVVGHVGLTPQSVHAMGGFKVQGRNESGAEQVLLDAHAVVEAGAFMVVLEGIPKELAERVTQSLPVPTIGIGAGVGCDGQVLVCTDLLGMNPEFSPKFVRNFIDGYSLIRSAFEDYIGAVQSRSFPNDAESFSSPAAGERKAVGDKVTRLY